MVSGPGELALTNAQQVKIAAEVQNGLSWLGGQSPARDVTWLHDNRHVTIPTPPAPRIPRRGREHWEHYERPWRDAVLQQMGFPKGKAGVDDYIASLKTSKSADAAYCAFFVHYPLNHFAYCTGPYLVMQYENDDWRPGNLDRVFAHESGHVFGAPDEYAKSECNCRGRHGFFGQPNLNCENCAPDGAHKVHHESEYAGQCAALRHIIWAIMGCRTRHRRDPTRSMRPCMEQLLILNQPQDKGLRQSIERKARVVQEGSDKLLDYRGLGGRNPGSHSVAGRDGCRPIVGRRSQEFVAERTGVPGGMAQPRKSRKKSRTGDGLSWGLQGI